MRLSRCVTEIVVGCAAVVGSAMPSLAGQMPQRLTHAAAAKATPQSGRATGMAATCEAMLAYQEKMMTEMKAADQRLDDLVSTMNAASGTEKADATAAVVNELVTQRRATCDGMMKMQHEMMTHMMEHMQAGNDSTAKGPMTTPVGGMTPGAQTPVQHEMVTMNMDSYFTALNYPVPQDMLMVMALSDFQSARSTNDFFTGMAMVQYGVTPRWTVGLMVEGQKIFGLPTTYGGFRINSYLRVFPHDRLLNFTVYGEYEGLNGAALYKMEVAGFGGEDLNEPLEKARRTPVRTFELRAIMYHDWGRVNLTVNFINETGLDSGDNDFGYAGGVFRQPAYRAMETDTDMAGMTGMPRKEAPPAFSLQRLGYGIEMMGALGNTHQFGFDWRRQQQYVGPVFSYAVSRHWTVHVEPAFGLSEVSDPLVLRLGVGYSIDHLLHRRSSTERRNPS